MHFRLKPLAAAALLASALAAPVRAGESLPITHYGSGLYGMPFAVALGKGYFKEAGLDIDGIITSPGGGSAVRNVLSNSLPLGEGGIMTSIAAKNSALSDRMRIRPFDCLPVAWSRTRRPRP